MGEDTTAAILAAGTAGVGAFVALTATALGAAPGWRDARWIPFAAWTASAFAAVSALALVSGSPRIVVAATGLQYALAALHVLAWLSHSARLLALRPIVVRIGSGALLATAAVLAIPGVAFGEPIRHRTVAWMGTYADPTPRPLAHLAAAVLVSLLLGLAVLHLRAHRRGIPNTLVTGSAMLLLAAGGVHDELALAGLSGGPDLLAPGALVPLLAVGWLTATRFVAEARELAALRELLERRVRGRTEVLALSREALRRTEELASLGRIARRLAHEVNNPVASVGANLAFARDALASGGPPDDVSEALGDALESVRRVRTLAHRLAALGESGPASRRTAVPLESAVLEALALARARVAGGDRVDVRVDVREAAFVEGPILVRTLETLLENALRAAAARPPGWVRVRTERAGPRVGLRIEDGGPGMDEAVLRLLGEPLFTTRPFESHGLGVATARALAATLEGELRFESAPGEGTRAILELPAASASGPAPAPTAGS